MIILKCLKVTFESGILTACCFKDWDNWEVWPHSWRVLFVFLSIRRLHEGKGGCPCSKQDDTSFTCCWTNKTLGSGSFEDVVKVQRVGLMQTWPQRQRKQGSWGLFALEDKHLCSALKTPPEESSCLLPLTQSHLHTSLSLSDQGATLSYQCTSHRKFYAGINSLNKQPDLMLKLSTPIWETLGFPGWAAGRRNPTWTLPGAAHLSFAGSLKAPITWQIHLQRLRSLKEVLRLLARAALNMLSKGRCSWHGC